MYTEEDEETENEKGTGQRDERRKSGGIRKVEEEGRQKVNIKKRNKVDAVR